jgi:hypothetical protein
MRHGARGPGAERTIQDFGQDQLEALQNAQSKLRDVDLNGNDIGDILGEDFRNANAAARRQVSALYDRAFDPDALAQAGVAPNVPIESVYGLRNKLAQTFGEDSDLVVSPALTPYTDRAIKLLSDFSDKAGVPSTFPKRTMPPAGELVSGIDWRLAEDVRKRLNVLRRNAASTGNAADLSGMRQVLDVFDEELGKSNPLLNEARAAHAARVAHFEPQRLNAAGTNPILRSLSNANETGQAIYNRLFGGATMKRGEAGALVDQLRSIYGEGSSGMRAVKEGALRRLMVDPNGNLLSPQKTATAIRNALNGPQGPVYRALLSPEELSRLQRYADTNGIVGAATAARNPSKTSYGLIRSILGEALRHKTAGLGVVLGAPFGPGGMAAGGVIGDIVGRTAGKSIEDRLGLRAARKAVSGVP